MATTAGSTRINIDLALNTRGFRPLGRINGQLGEFEKSLDASNARVLAFGASAGAILAVKKAFTATVKAAVEVEKSLKDINVILQATDKNLKKFGSDLFKIASDTGQSFRVAAEAATELARQGLGTAETLKRTRDALILTRLSGMDAAEAVNALTAALNTFTKVGLDSTAIINKLANVDAAFAVSSEDLAKALGRVGSSAVSAGVNLDQLLAIVTTAQQKTARGGAVIGNSFKTIFTRIQRPRVIKELENLGIQVRGLEGDTLPAIKVLTNLAKSFDSLTQSQRAQISELVGGVFQVNVLKAALSDLNREQGIYNRALGISVGSSDQAIRRNEELNQTLAAQFQKTMNTFKQAAAELGTLTLAPALENIFGAVNSTFEAAAGEGDLAKAGQLIGKSVFEAIGKFIGGPGLIIIGGVLFKTFANLATFAADAFKTLTGLNSQFQNQLNLQKQIFGVLSENPDVMNRIRAGTMSVEDAHQLVLQRINEETTALDRQLLVSNQIAAALSRGNVSFSPDFGATAGGVRKFGGRGAFGRGRSGGYVPNFANEEVLGMMMGGYSSSQLANPKVRRDTIHNGRGGAFSALTNGHESVVDFTNSKGKKATAVIPPKGSGAYEDFIKALSGGYIPNFFNDKFGGGRGSAFRTASAVSRGKIGEKYAGATITKEDQKEANAWLKKNPKTKKTAKKAPTVPFFDVGGYYGVLSLFGETNNNSTITASTSGITAIKGAPVGVRPEKIQIGGFQQKSFLGKYDKKDSQTNNEYAALIKKHMAGPLVDLTNEFFGPRLLQEFRPAGQIINKMRGQQGGALFPKGAEGSIFEASINALTKNAIGFEKTLRGDPNATWDFEENGFAGPKLRDDFGFSSMLKLADGKRSVSDSAMTSLGNKVFTSIDKGGRGTGSNKIKAFINEMQATSAARGYIPSFSALHNAITRERSAGIPSSKIRVGRSRSLASGLNPMGLGVYNTQDEPGGLGQGIRRSLARGMNPKTAGVPNFADAGPDKSLAENTNRMMKLTGAIFALQTGMQLLTNATDDGSFEAKENGVKMEALSSALMTMATIGMAGSMFDSTKGIGKALTSNISLGGMKSGMSDLAAMGAMSVGDAASGMRRGARKTASGIKLNYGVNRELHGMGRAASAGRAVKGAAMATRAGGAIAGGMGAAGAALATPLGIGVAAVGVGMLTDHLLNEGSAVSKEARRLAHVYEKTAEETEKNIGILNKLGDSMDAYEKTFHDSDASIRQVMAAHDQVTKTLSELPSNIQAQLRAIINPQELKQAVEAAKEAEGAKKDAAQRRADTQKDFQRMSETVYFGRSDAREEEEKGLGENIVRRSMATGDQDFFKDRSAQDLNADMQKLLRAQALTDADFAGGDSDAARLLGEVQKNMGIEEQARLKNIEIMEEDTNAATHLINAQVKLFEEAIKNAKMMEAERKAREDILTSNKEQRQALDAAKKAMAAEQKIRLATIPILKKGAQAFLTGMGRVNLDDQIAQDTIRRGFADRFKGTVTSAEGSLEAASLTKGFAGTALASQISATLQAASTGGVGSIDSAAVEQQITELKKIHANSDEYGKKNLEALESGLEALLASNNHLGGEMQEQLHVQKQTAEASRIIAKQQQNLTKFGGAAAARDPSRLNNAFSQIMAGASAERMSLRIGSRQGLASARATKFAGMQEAFGGQLPERLRKQAVAAQFQASVGHMTMMNRELGGGMSRQEIVEAARQQAENAFKGDSVDRNTSALESLTMVLENSKLSHTSITGDAMALSQIESQQRSREQALYGDYASRIQPGIERMATDISQGARESSLYTGKADTMNYGFLPNVLNPLMPPERTSTYSRDHGRNRSRSAAQAYDQFMAGETVDTERPHSGAASVSFSPEHEKGYTVNVNVNGEQVGGAQAEQIKAVLNIIMDSVEPSARKRMMGNPAIQKVMK